MVAEQIASRGIRDARVLSAMASVPRHLFVPREQRDAAYEDYPLSIGRGQTISQPYIVAYMTELLELTGEERVLEIGTGSGYQTAVLAELVSEIWTVEIVELLFRRARRLLVSLGYENINFIHGDGYAGAVEAAPFDRIILTAAAPRPPEPLLAQLRPGGMLLLPQGSPRGVQELVLMRKNRDGFNSTELAGVRFVPMTGRISRQR